MVLARWQATVQDNEGNVLPAASVRVEREATGFPLATIYSDRAGTVPLGNPFPADSEGFAAFHVAGGAYRITVTSGATARTYRYVAIGLAAERDTIDPGISFLFDAGVNDADPGTGEMRFNNSTPGLATKIFISETDADGIDVGAWLGTWDDAGGTSNRGTVIIQGGGGVAKVIGRVTGTVADDGSYRDVTITVISSGGTFVAGERVGVSFASNGTDGTGDVNGPAGGVVDGEVTLYNGTGGKTIKGSGKTLTTIATGKRTIWMPASSMLQGASTPTVPSFNKLSMPSSNIPIQVQAYDFDPSTEENLFFWIPMPKSWDVGSITFKYVWSHAATVTNFGTCFAIFVDAFGNDDTMQINSTGSISTVDTGGTTNDIYVSPESLPLAVANRAAEDLLHFRLTRVVANAADTLAVDARLHGILVHFTDAANTDA
jgi:hypothetical protein